MTQSSDEHLEDTNKSIKSDERSRARLEVKEPTATILESEVTLVSDEEPKTVLRSAEPTPSEPDRRNTTEHLSGEPAPISESSAHMSDAVSDDQCSTSAENSTSTVEVTSGAPPLLSSIEDDGSARLKEVLRRLTEPRLRVWVILAGMLFSVFLIRAAAPGLSFFSSAAGNYGLAEFFCSIQIGPKEQEYFSLGEAYEKRGDIANAERLYRKTAVHKGRTDKVALTMAGILDKGKKYSEADTYYLNIEKRTNIGLQNRHARRVVDGTGATQGTQDKGFAGGQARTIALPRLMRLLGQIPPDVRAKHFSWAMPYWNRMEQTRSSPAIAEIVQIDLRPVVSDFRSDMNDRKRPPSKGPTPALSAKTANDEGMRFGKEGRLREAIECFDQVISANPDRAIGYVNKAITQRKTGDSVTALRTLDQAVSKVPEDAELYLLRSMVLTDLGKHEDARADFERGYKMDAEMGHTYDRGKVVTGEELAQYLSAIGKETALKEPATSNIAKEYFPDKDSKLLLRSDMPGEQLGQKMFPASPKDLVPTHYFILDHRDYFKMQDLAKRAKARQNAREK